MKILISGAAGYIGSMLANELLSSENEITCLDNLMFNQKNHSLLTKKNVKFVVGDVRDKSLMKEL